MEKIQFFESKQIWSHLDKENELWYFSIVDIVTILIWNKFK